ncbi:MAG: ABC transporter ATP-binding protein [Motilibacteraceae bacterium]
MAETLVRLTGLSKSYGSKEALRDVDLVLSPGVITGLVGPNGAGKSTLMKAVLGLLQVTGGAGGAGGAGGSVVTARAGFTLEPPGLDPTLTVARHFQILRRACGASTADVDALMTRCEIHAFAQTRIKRLSTGQRQRVAIASALLSRPELVVLDEPTNGLDPESVRWLRNLLREVADAGAAVLVSSHALSELQLVVDEVVVLAAGTVRFAGTLDDLLSASESSTLEEAYFTMASPTAGRAL